MFNNSGNLSKVSAAKCLLFQCNFYGKEIPVYKCGGTNSSCLGCCYSQIHLVCCFNLFKHLFEDSGPFQDFCLSMDDNLNLFRH